MRPRLVAWHFNHHVRGVASDEDAEFCRELCQALEIPLVMGQREEAGLASELVLREARQAFFATQRASSGIRVVVTAHHLDDVVESMLLRLARGAGPVGLAAPREVQSFRDGHVHWRPLIAAGLTKEFLKTELQRVGLPWREDATNAQPVATRNRVRAWLFQGGAVALGEHYQAGFARSARLQDDYHQALMAWAASLGVQPQERAGCLVSPLQQKPATLIYAVLVHFLQLQGLSDCSVVSLHPIVEAIRVGHDVKASVQGRLVEVQQGHLRLLPQGHLAWGDDLRKLEENTVCPESGLLAERCAVDATLWASLSRGDISPQYEVYLSVSPAAVLTWRGRQEGDRFQPLGAPGSALLADMLINRKIPVEQRDALPVVLADSQILWVPGVPPAEAFKLQGPTSGALRLTWRSPCLNSTIRS
jgi:tRNA(Ile)-lysidine synthase